MNGVLIALLVLNPFTGIAERVDYVPGSGREDLFPAAQLKLCDMPCTVHAVQAKLSLATKHIDKGCDRDTYSVSSQRKICGKRLINCPRPSCSPLMSYKLNIRFSVERGIYTVVYSVYSCLY